MKAGHTFTIEPMISEGTLVYMYMYIVRSGNKYWETNLMHIHVLMLC